MYAFNLSTQAFREITSSITPANLTIDENANLIVYVASTTRKVYTFGADESILTDIVTKTIALTDDEKGLPIRHLAVTYKSGDAVTVKVWLENEIVSGDIQPGTTYYNNGYTKVAYNGNDYATTETFEGVAGKGTYVETGTGTVELYMIDQDTGAAPVLAANNSTQTRKIGIHERAKKIRIELSTSASTNAVEINRITVYFD